jgi:hypothetical protein
MANASVQLPIEDWNKVLAILAQAPWGQVNPLLMQIGEQLRHAGGPRPNGAMEQEPPPQRQ